MLRTELKKTFQKKPITFLDKQIKSIIDNRYHAMHKKIALNNLKHIEKNKGKLDSRVKKTVDEYAKEVLGSKVYSPWLYVYSAVAGGFKENWIPDNYYGRVVVPNIQGNYGCISEYNTLNKVLINKKYLSDLYYYVNGQWLTKNHEILSLVDMESIFHTINEKLIFKKDNTAQGKGVFVIDEKNKDFKFINSNGDGVIKEYIQQHPFFNRFMPNSVATIRLTTYLNEDGSVNVKAGYLRFGRNSDTHVQSASNIRVPLDVENGALGEIGYLNYWEEISEHPDSKEKFKDNYIPEFQTCKSVIKNLHKSIPFVKIIGWDFILNLNNQIQIMEWNGYHNDIKFSEAIQGPIFKGLGFEEMWKDKYSY